MDTGEPLWWLSFVDNTKPQGERFIGVSIVTAPNQDIALRNAWKLGLNQGGHVMIYPMMPEIVPAELRNKALTMEQIRGFTVRR